VAPTVPAGADTLVAMSAEANGRHMPTVVSLDDLTAMMTESRRLR
jgi:hypothetical protein